MKSHLRVFKHSKSVWRISIEATQLSCTCKQRSHWGVSCILDMVMVMVMVIVMMMVISPMDISSCIKYNAMF